MRRRQFLQGGLALAVTSVLPRNRAMAADSQSVFRHGVASGDPLTDRVIIWTRINSNQPTIVHWQVFADRNLRQMVQEGQVFALPQHDFTVKVDIHGLLPGQRYYYRFLALGESSPIGRTKTLPLDPQEVRFGVVSCSNYPFGFFNVYGLLAERDDLDFILHLGDYIYEYAEGHYGTGTPLGRAPDPLSECIHLNDYRRRYAIYRTDPDLQAAHAAHSFITVWDDHELTNDCWKHGAENHNPGEGSWEVRKKEAIRAYFEWLPIRPLWTSRVADDLYGTLHFNQLAGTEGNRRWQEGDPVIYRQFQLGRLADLFMLDTRVIGRDKPLDVPDGVDVYKYASQFPQRSMMGEVQEQWLYRSLLQSKKRGARWRLLGQQVQMAQRTPGWDDIWDGYAPNRARLFQVLQKGVDNTVVLTGDIHSSWAAELSPNPFDANLYDPASGRGSLAVEFITPSVTSPSSYNSLSENELNKAQTEIYAQHPHIKFCELKQHGYLEIQVTDETTKSIWHYVKTIASRDLTEVQGPTWLVRSGMPHLQQT